MNQMPFPFSLIPTFNANAAQHADNLYGKLGALYGQSMQAATQELWTSSARIIQDHATRAWIDASQSCMHALSENAAAVQQRAFTRLIQDNQKAGQLVTEEVGSAMVTAFQSPG